MLQIVKSYIPQNDGFEEIVPIYDTIFGKMVNGRELHAVLGVKKKYADWIKNYTKGYNGYDYKNTENHPVNPSVYDYFMFECKSENKTGRKIEYMLTLDAAKEVAMMSRTEAGRAVRKYFIEADKAFKQVISILQNETASSQEKIAEALIISNKLLLNKDIAIKKAIRNKEYNKRMNVLLRRKVKELKARVEELSEKPIIITQAPISDSIKNAAINDSSYNQIEEELRAREEKVVYLEGSIEELEDKNARLEARLQYLTRIKVDGRQILNAFAIADIERRQKFAMGAKAKNDAKILAYKYRKDAILKAGIITNDSDKPFVENINVEDLPKAIDVYCRSLKRTIGDDELYNLLFANQIKRANDFLAKSTFEEENNTIKEEEICW